MKIMILDDEPELLSSLTRILVTNGHEVEPYQSAEMAIAPIENNNFDFALVDYLMPEYTGIWFMEHAKVPKKTKVLLMTAFVNKQVISRMFELGICGYIIKPFGEEDIKIQLAFHSNPAAQLP